MNKNVTWHREFRIILIMAVTGIFDYYYMGLLSFALPQMQQHFHLQDKEIGPLVALFRLGFIPAALIAVIADFTGRKPFIIFSTSMLIVCSVWSAKAATLGSFVASQFTGFMFISAEMSVAIVFIVEEAKQIKRAFAVSIFTGFSAAGAGSAAIIYGINAYFHLPFQYTYYYGFLPLLVLLVLRSNIRETSLFSSLPQRSAAFTLKEKIGSWYAVFKSGTRQMVIISVIALFNDACVVPAYVLASKYLQDEHHFLPEKVSTLIVLSGSIATITAVGISYLSDIAGRKKILVCMMAATGISVLFFYHTSGQQLYVAWFLFIIASSATANIIMTVGTELFATGNRVSASGIRGMFSAVGGACGLLIEGALAEPGSSHTPAISLLTLFLLAGALAAGLFIPETYRKNLQQPADELS